MPWKFPLHWNIFHLSGFLWNLSLPWKQSLSWNFSLHLIYFLQLGCLSNFCLPEKQSVLWIHCIEFEFFNIQNFEQLALALKIFTALKYFLSFRIFEELELALKTEFYLKFFTVLNIVFTFRIFEQLVLALKNRVCPEFTVSNTNISYHSDFWTACACPEKQNLPWNFSMYWNIFYLSGFLRNLSLPWKQSLPWIFQVGGVLTPRPSASYATDGREVCAFIGQVLVYKLN